VILHLAPAEDWARGDDPYRPASLDQEGFVHASPDDGTMLAVANRFYAGRGDELVVLSIDEGRLTSEVRWEAPAHPDGRPAGPDEPRFPHVYGPVERAAVVDVRRIVRDEVGTYVAIHGAS
jgi:hypothetical protein